MNFVESAIGAAAAEAAKFKHMFKNIFLSNN